MELKDTINLMQSEDYKERFAAEYWQTKNRYEKLHKMLIKAEAGTLPFTPTCPIHLLEDQEHTMECYLRHLEVRAEIEGIDLEWYAAEKKPRVNVETGEMLVREGVVYKVVCSDKDTFVIAKCYKDKDETFVTRFDMIDVYSNDPSVSTLEYMEFERYTQAVGT